MDPSIWETKSTLSRDMKDMLSTMRYSIAEFDYGYEWIADSITKPDLGTLSSHIANEEMAFLRVDHG